MRPCRSIELRRACVSATLAAFVLATTTRAVAQDARGDADVAPPTTAAPVGAQPPGAAPAVAGDAPLTPRREPLGTKPTTDPFMWRYPEFRTSEYWVTGIFGAMALGGLAIPTGGGRWTTRNDFDSGVRDALRLGTREGRKTADDISDVTLILSLNYVAFDAAVVAWWARNKGSVAYQMAAIDIETLAITAGVTSLVKGIAARERPYSAECSDPIVSRTHDCDEQSLDRSYLSGHTSTAFASAGLTCMHHAYLELYKDPFGDAVACVAALGAAGTTGVLRIMSDNHHTTDVVSGAVLGTALGLGIPWVLHYKDEVGGPTGAVEPSAVTVTFIPGPTSGTFLGTF